MNTVRKYGRKPFTVAVIHGGPGATGEVKPLAEELSKNFGILEPLQTATSVEAQVQELKTTLEQHASLPVILVGYSWGAWLSYILTAKYPELVKKLILVGSGPFEAQYAEQIMDTRLDRLNDQEKNEVDSLLKELNEQKSNSQDILGKFGRLISKTDSYKPIPKNDENIEIQQSIYQSVWPEANELRKNGGLLKLGEKIKCPVVAIHGDYDPHPAEGVKKPLLKVVKNFRFILLKNCGHKPWIEQKAKDEFYIILKKESAAEPIGRKISSDFFKYTPSR